jgi:hypothetical protein
MQVPNQEPSVVGQVDSEVPADIVTVTLPSDSQTDLGALGRWLRQDAYQQSDEWAIGLNTHQQGE